ncbi:TAXI family TRAP transporter solute-binding subunit [Telmatospirillum sp. J64-1]|uniref:TAXI family TRAP transporter solute-binding subunit n=1 Tax=Telmatospirillum sp. J64-1 TaxID=2502183 RepID=UPI00115D9EEB|nr:TAXI family TRAP transporter solute-binding subunit [Telmatospirillum sp. J64-1]
MGHSKIVAAAFAGILFASGQAAAENLVYSGVATTSDDYALGVLWSNALAEAGSKTRMTVVENGTVSGIRKVAQGEVDIVGIGAPNYLDAVEGTAQFEKDPPRLREAYKDMRVILSIPTGMAQYVARADSGIHTFRDLDGKSVGIGRPGGNAGRVSEILFDLHGLGKVNAQRLEYGAALDQMAAGSMDATLVWGGIPMPAIDNASRGTALRFISPDPKTQQAFRETVTNGQYYVYQEVSADVLKQAYDGRIAVDGPVYFWTFPFQIMVRGDVDEQTVYDLTKALWTNIDRIREQSIALSLISLDTALEGLSGQIHPGAERYYREIGKLD